MRRAGSKIRVTAELIAPENGEQLWTGRYDRDMGDLFAMQDEITTNLSRGARAGDLSRGSLRAGAVIVHRPHRMGPLPEGALPLLPADQGRLRSLDRPVPGGHRARSGACHRARLSRHHHGAGRAVWMDQEHARIVAEAMELAESSVRLDPRSSFAFSILSYVHAMEGRYEAAMDAARRAVELNPYDMGARGVLGICHLRRSASIGEAIELFSTAVQRGNSDPRYQWAALNAFSHYLLRQYDASLSWAREALYSIPIICRCSAVRAAALAQLGRTEEAARAIEILLGNYPGPHRRTTLEEFPLENSGRYRALSRRTFEGRRTVAQSVAHRRPLGARGRFLKAHFGRPGIWKDAVQVRRDRHSASSVDLDSNSAKTPVHPVGSASLAECPFRFKTSFIHLPCFSGI